MALFTGNVWLRPEEAATLVKFAKAAEGIDATLKAILAKLNEDDTAQQAQLDDLTGRLNASTDTLQAKTGEAGSR